MPALSKKVKLLQRGFWEIKISKRDQTIKSQQIPGEAGIYPEGVIAANVPGSWAQHRAWPSPKEKSDGFILKQCASCECDRDEQQHRALPRAALSTHGAQCGGDREQGVLQSAEGERKAGREKEILWEEGVAGVWCRGRETPSPL